MYSYFVPEVDGLYKVWMRSDDSSRFYMNTNAVNSTDRNGIVTFGQVSGFVAAYNVMAQNLPLKAGQRYYTEFYRWKEGGGGDGVSVVFTDQSVTTAPNQSTDS